MYESLCNRFRAIDTDLVAALQRARYSSRTTSTQHALQTQHKQKRHQNLTRFKVFTVEFCVRACAIAVAPRTPTLLQFCSAHINLHTRHQLNTICKHSTTKNRDRNLTRLRVPTLEFCVRACAITFAPLTPIWLPSCTTYVTPYARQQRSTRCKHSTNKK
jgi:hypothetical protein